MMKFEDDATLSNSSGRNCLTLRQFASNPDNYLRLNTTLIMQPGNFTLGQSLTISNIDFFDVHHESNPGDMLLCNQSGNLRSNQLKIFRFKVYI